MAAALTWPFTWMSSDGTGCCARRFLSYAFLVACTFLLATTIIKVLPLLSHSAVLILCRSHLYAPLIHLSSPSASRISPSSSNITHKTPSSCSSAASPVSPALPLPPLLHCTASPPSALLRLSPVNPLSNINLGRFFVIPTGSLLPLSSEAMPSWLARQ